MGKAVHQIAPYLPVVREFDEAGDVRFMEGAEYAQFGVDFHEETPYIV